jgi:Uma2 family endonuclease
VTTQADEEVAMAPPPPRRKGHVSVAEYLQGERHAEVRHEGIDGEVYAMVGASDAHGLIVTALAYARLPTLQPLR